MADATLLRTAEKPAVQTDHPDAGMRILLCDTTFYPGVNPYFVDAIARLSEERDYQYEVFDVAAYIPRHLNLFQRFVRRTISLPARIEQNRINRALLTAARRFRPDLLIAVNGKALLARTLATIRAATGAFIVAVPTDDPFATRSVPQTARTAVTQYDLWMCPKRAVIPDLLAAGCANVRYIHYWYRTSVHFPEVPATAEEKRKFAADVAFIGGGDKERQVLFSELIRRMPSLNLAIYGSSWHGRALAPYLRGPVSGRDFRLALGGTRIALQFARYAQRDDHSERSIQTPACGAFMLAERTESLLKIFSEGAEAGFFSGIDELCEKISYYLAHDQERRNIASAGWRRISSGGFSDFDRLVEIVDTARALASFRHGSFDLPGAGCKPTTAGSAAEASD
jgi:spore maturation protein CgeB